MKPEFEKIKIQNPDGITYLSISSLILDMLSSGTGSDFSLGEKSSSRNLDWYLGDNLDTLKDSPKIHIETLQLHTK